MGTIYYPSSLLLLLITAAEAVGTYLLYNLETTKEAAWAELEQPPFQAVVQQGHGS